MERRQNIKKEIEKTSNFGVKQQKHQEKFATNLKFIYLCRRKLITADRVGRRLARKESICSITHIRKHL